VKINKIIYMTLIIILSFSILSGAQEPVKVVQPKRGDINISETVAGKIVPAKTINLPSEINGVVKKIYVSIGEKVNQGDKLLEFDKSQILIQKKQSEATLEAAQSNFNQVLRGASQEDIETAEANYKQAQISLASAKKSLEIVRETYQDKTSLKQQLINAEMQLASAEKQLQSAAERVKQAEKALQQAEVGVKQAKNNLTQAKNDYDRMGKLYKDNVISKQQMEGAKLQLENAQSSYDNAHLQVENAHLSIKSAEIAEEQAEISLTSSKQIYEITKKTYDNPTQLKQQLHSAETQVEVSEVNLVIAETNLKKIKKGADQDQIQAVRASIKQAEAGLEQINLQLSKTIIKSPISAHIASVNTEENEMVAAGTPVVNLAVIDQLNVDTTVTPDLRPYIKVGDEVEIIIKNGGSKQYAAVIKNISPIINPQNEAYPIKLQFIDVPQNVYAGMFVDVRFQKSSSKEALSVPIDSVFDLYDVPYLFVVEDGKVAKRELEVGLIFQDRVEVLGGLNEDDQLIIQGQQKVADGDTVEVVE